MQGIPTPKPAKDQREKLLLLGLVELYLQLGKPVGSNTLRECGFESLSSATIRNYFAKMEEQGYLVQHHASGGRVPTPKAYRYYVDHLEDLSLEKKELSYMKTLLGSPSKQVATYLQRAAEIACDLSGCAVIVSAPRFDQDYIFEMKLLSLDSQRCLCVILTDFGMVHTEILHTEKKLSLFSLRRLEEYFHYRLTNLDRPALDDEEAQLGERLFSEIMLRHIANYNYFTSSDIYKTGFSKLLAYPELSEPTALASSLAVFENKDLLLEKFRSAEKNFKPLVWVSEELFPEHNHPCSMVAHPYRLNQNLVGSIAFLGPTRMNYTKIQQLAQALAISISEGLSESLNTYKITFRTPNEPPLQWDPIVGIEEKGVHT